MCLLLRRSKMVPWNLHSSYCTLPEKNIR
jgi:hypothetical protein